MATAKTKEEMVTVKLPRPKKGESDAQFVSVNGKNYLVKKGVEVDVPVSVKEVLDNADSARDAQYAYTKSKQNS